MSTKYRVLMLFISFLSLGLVFGTLAFAKNNEQAPSLAAIELTQTVGTDPSQCATTKYLLSLDRIVTYCYHVTNTGLITLTVHDLTDTFVGTILSGFQYDLDPGESFFVTRTVELTQTTTNTATWTASDTNLSGSVSDSDTTTVHVLAACSAGYIPKRIEAATFTTFPPGGWTLANTTTGCSAIPGWTDTDPGARGNLTGGTGSFAIADGDACGPGSLMNASMMTSPLNFTDILNPQVVFFSDYKDSDPYQGTATVDVSTDSGATWSNLITWNESQRGPNIISSSLPGVGENDVMVRWQISDATSGDWWEVDNAFIVVCAPQPADIEVNPSSLGSTQPPGAQVTKTLKIANLGTLALNWSIQESSNILGSPVKEAPQTPSLVPGILYDQTNNPGIHSISSQAYDLYATANDHQAADDFVVPASDGAWAIYSIFVPGEYTGEIGQIPYANVLFYADAGGLPGQEVYSYSHLKPVGDASGDLTIELRYPAVLTAGTYWVSVQAQTFGTSNLQWGWTERTAQTLSASAWRNPGGGLSTPCTNWGSRAGACNIGTQPDLLFQLLGASSGCVPTDIPWASVSPGSGTTASKGSSQVAVTFDSTGLLNGAYNGKLCILSNDPAEPFVNIPLQLTVDTQPSISLEKTVGVNPGVCANTDLISVTPDTNVTYCYKITNTGTVMIATHNLFDDQLGALLSNYPFELPPGASTFILATTPIRYTTTNTATWTGFTESGLSAAGVDSATVLVVSTTPNPTSTGSPTPTSTPTPAASPTPQTTPPKITPSPTPIPTSILPSTNKHELYLPFISRK